MDITKTNEYRKHLFAYVCAGFGDDCGKKIPSLGDIPMQFRTKEMCCAAVFFSELNYKYIPDKFKDEKGSWFGFPVPNEENFDQ